jgi:cyanophycinase
MLKLACRSACIFILALATAAQALPQAPIKEQPQPRGQTTPAPVVAAPPAPVVEINKPQPAPKGSLVIIGGGLRGETAPVWQRIVALAGGPGAKIAVFGSASHNPERAALADVEQLNAYGADAFVVPVATHLAGTDYRIAANDPELAKEVASAGGAFFVGGNQARITAALRKPDGSNTLVLDALWDMYRRGGVIAGTSAGAAMMSKTMFYQVNSVLSTLKRGVADGMELSHGLGFIGDDIFVDQHLLVRGRFARMLPAMLAKGYKYGLGIDENTAMVIGPDRDVEIIGYKGALLLDLTQASIDPTVPAFNLSNVKISYLDNGDHYSFVTNKATPSPDKAGGAFDPKRPYYRGPLFTADVLGHTAVVDLMTKLVDSDQQEAIGIAFGSPRDLQPDLGFEFKLSRTKESVGYASAIYDAYSAYYLRMDVKPITIKQPFYEYRTATPPALPAAVPAPTPAPAPVHSAPGRKP